MSLLPYIQESTSQCYLHTETRQLRCAQGADRRPADIDRAIKQVIDCREDLIARAEEV